jgi:hypothetical protein
MMDELLTDEERRVRDKVRAFSDEEVIPIINDYWERAAFPFELIPKLAALGIAGSDIHGYGCPGLSMTASGLIAVELARGDASVCTFFGVHSGLAMHSISMLGSEEQKQRWLPHRSPSRRHRGRLHLRRDGYHSVADRWTRDHWSAGVLITVAFGIERNNIYGTTRSGQDRPARLRRWHGDVENV